MEKSVNKKGGPFKDVVKVGLLLLQQWKVTNSTERFI